MPKSSRRHSKALRGPRPALLLIVLFLFAGGCGRLLPSPAPPPRSRVLPPFPVVLWVDWQGTAPHIDDAGAARAFCRLARQAGVTHLAMEARTSSGEWALGPAGPHATAHTLLHSAAREAGLSLAGVLPAFMGAEPPPMEERPLRARWTQEGGWSLVHLGEGLEARTSPASATARAHELETLRRLRDDPSLEFILLSGFGYEDALADLGPAGRLAFERWRGGAVRDWPGGILGERPPATPHGVEGRGPLWDSWVTWRGELLRDLLVRMRAELAIDPTPPRLLALVDAPYPAHQRLGLNWASPGTPAETEHAWLPRPYGRQTASGHLLDAVVLAHWHPRLLGIEEAGEEGFAWWASLEGSAALAHRYRGRQSLGPWFAFIAEEGNGWQGAVRLTPALGGGLVLLSSARFLENPGLWDDLTNALEQAGRVPLTR